MEGKGRIIGATIDCQKLQSNLVSSQKLTII